FYCNPVSLEMRYAGYHTPTIHTPPLHPGNSNFTQNLDATNNPQADSNRHSEAPARKSPQTSDQLLNRHHLSTSDKRR
ncbi:hypothetical protein V9T16_32365, partial [Pseudomonas aeruginosa]